MPRHPTSLTHTAFRWLLVIVGMLGAMSGYAQGRRERSLDANWRFLKSDPAGASESGFRDQTWERVNLPHTFNVEDGADGGTYYRGPCWYRTHFVDQGGPKGRRLFLRFGAASLRANVFLNGKLVGEHRGGFGAFCFEVTSLVKQGDNVLAVRVTNEWDQRFAPLSGDFTIYGGLYRGVSLISLGDIGISPTDDAGPGVYVSSSTYQGQTMVQVRSIISTSSESPADAHVTATLRDARGRVVGEYEKGVMARKDQPTEVVEQIEVPRPHLWDGVNDPYHYTVTVEVKKGRRVVDRVQQKFGIRTFSVEPDRGLILNGKPYDMHGVNIHQGRPGTGWADSSAMQDEDYGLVRELGCTGVRMAHYQHAPHEYEICDQMGFVVWAELALVNQMTDSPEFRENAKDQLRELIKQNYNHPSILFWSMYNEPWIDRQKGDKEWKLVEDLVKLSHDLDPSRLTTGAASIGANHWLDWAMDVGSFNRYWGWYDGAPSLWTTRLDAMKKEAGGRSFGMSEYGAGASVKQHADNPRQPSPGGAWHPEEWQTTFHESAWPVLQVRPWVWCKLIWVMFDFSSDGRKEGDHAGINDKGLVTGDRLTKKDAFYYYKAQWSKEAFAYIADRRFNPRHAGPAEVKVYSNCDSVELFVDGKSLGVKTSADHVFRWPLVALHGPETKVEAVAHQKGKTVRDKVLWTLP